MLIPTDHVRPDPSQPRKLFTPAELDELAGMIRSQGQLQDALVRSDPDKGEGYYIIIAGERRYRAICQLGDRPLSATVRDDIGPEDLHLVQIIENLGRSAMTPLEEAAAFQCELDRGLSVADLASKLGMKQAWRITERTDLLKLRPEYRDLLTSGNLTSSQAFEMAQQTPQAQVVLFRAIKAGKVPTYGALRAMSLSLQEAGKQISILDAMPPRPEATEAEQAAARGLERKITTVCDMLATGFDDGACVAVKKIDPGKAATMADKLALIRKHLAMMENALRAAAVQAELLAA